MPNIPWDIFTLKNDCLKVKFNWMFYISFTKSSKPTKSQRTITSESHPAQQVRGHPRTQKILNRVKKPAFFSPAPWDVSDMLSLKGRSQISRYSPTLLKA